MKTKFFYFCLENIKKLLLKIKNNLKKWNWSQYVHNKTKVIQAWLGDLLATTMSTLRGYCVVGGGTEKVNIINHKQPLPTRTSSCYRDEDSCWALGPTCAAHSAVQMRPYFPAAHFMDVISSPIYNFSLQASIPERHSSVHRILHFCHPGVRLCRA